MPRYDRRCRISPILGRRYWHRRFLAGIAPGIGIGSDHVAGLGLTYHQSSLSPWESRKANEGGGDSVVFYFYHAPASPSSERSCGFCAVGLQEGENACKAAERSGMERRFTADSTSRTFRRGCPALGRREVREPQLSVASHARPFPFSARSSALIIRGSFSRLVRVQRRV